MLLLPDYKLVRIHFEIGYGLNQIVKTTQAMPMLAVNLERHAAQLLEQLQRGHLGQPVRIVFAWKENGAVKHLTREQTYAPKLRVIKEVQSC